MSIHAVQSHEDTDMCLRLAGTRVLVIDNYDSFTYNLVQCVGTFGASLHTIRNDRITVREALEYDPTHLLISPGPGRPEVAGVCIELIRTFAPRGVPILGVCLGHQAIVHAFGGIVGRAERIMHGKTSTINHDGQGIFQGLEQHIAVGRYHSLAAEAVSLPPDLIATALTPEGELMGVRHRVFPVEGVQFHPESVLTPQGPAMLRTFLEGSH